jgi:hypothetical protein
VTDDHALLVRALRDELEQPAPTIFGVLHRAAKTLPLSTSCALGLHRTETTGCNGRRTIAEAGGIGWEACDCPCHREADE